MLIQLQLARHGPQGTRRVWVDPDAVAIVAEGSRRNMEGWQDVARVRLHDGTAFTVADPDRRVGEAIAEWRMLAEEKSEPEAEDDEDDES